MTNRIIPTLLATALVSAAAAPAFAQPGAEPAPVPAPAAAPAPQTHDWNEVSHINGQLVKVGETNDYIKKFRKNVIATNPIGWITGFYGISVSHALTDHIALRGDINYIDPIEDESLKMWELGVGLPLYLRRTYQGPFVEPGFIVRATHEIDSSYSTDAAGNWIANERGVDQQTGGPQVLFGWQWTWDSGYTFAVAAGAGRNILSSTTNPYDDHPDELFANGYFRVGYSF